MSKKKPRKKLSLSDPISETSSTEDSERLDALMQAAPDRPSERIRTTFYIPEDLHRWLKMRAAQTGSSMSEIVTNLVENFREA